MLFALLVYAVLFSAVVYVSETKDIKLMWYHHVALFVSFWGGYIFMATM
jgi:hypothetical protein